MGEELLGFTRAAGPTRLEAAGRRGILQLVAPCGVNWGSPSKRDYKPEYKLRKKYDYDAARTFIRLSKDEMMMVADFVDELKMQLKPDIEVREVDVDLDTPEFAQAVVDAFDEIMVS